MVSKIKTKRTTALLIVALLAVALASALAHAAPNGGSDTLGCSTGPARTWYFA